MKGRCWALGGLTIPTFPTRSIKRNCLLQEARKWESSMLEPEPNYLDVTAFEGTVSPGVEDALTEAYEEVDANEAS